MHNLDRVADRFGSGRAGWLVDGSLLLVVLAAALLLRLYAMDAESLWWDEVASVMHLPAPADATASPYFAQWNATVQREEPQSFAHFFWNLRTLDPAAMPFYYAIQYAVATSLGPDPYLLRLLSVAISVGQVVLIYFFGRALFGRTAGFVAAICLALSVTHTYYGQEVRTYVAYSGTALASIATLWWAWERGGWGRWALHGIAQLCLTLTHPFGILVPAMQGLYLVGWQRGDLRRVIRWVLITAGAAFPAVVIVLFGTRYFDESHWLVVPGWRELGNALLGADSIGFGIHLRPNPRIWDWGAQVAPSAARQWADNVRVPLGVALGIVTGLLALYGLAMCAARRLPAIVSRHARWVPYLVLLWVGPALVLLVISYAWRPCLLPRYVLFSPLALYVLLGAAVTTLPRRSMQAAVVLVLALLHLYQQSLVIGSVKRTDYRSATAYIQREASPDDFIIVHNQLWMRVVAYHLGPIPNPIVFGDRTEPTAYSPELYECTTLLAAVALGPGAEGATAGRRTAWVVLRGDAFAVTEPPAFGEKLHRRGLAYERRTFNGLHSLHVYRVSQADPGVPPFVTLRSCNWDELAENGVQLITQGHTEDGARLLFSMGITALADAVVARWPVATPSPRVEAFRDAWHARRMRLQDAP